MHTIIQLTPSQSRRRPTRDSVNSEYRKPSYDCREQPDAVKLDVYVPGVEATGISIEVRGPDLIVTARKPQVVRINWQSLHLESVQRDYRLSLQLGTSLDYASLRAELHNSVLTLSLPKYQPTGPVDRFLKVA